MQQNKINILCTKAVDYALPEQASSGNVGVDIISFIKTEPSLTPDLLDEINNISQLPTVVFTSASAVEAVATSLDKQKIKPPGWRVFCIGHATKESVVNYFGEGSIAGVADTAEELATEILRVKINEVIFFCGDQRRDELPRLLKKNNIDVKEIIVYKTIATPQKIEGKYDGVLFFSPSAVKSFFQINQLTNETVLFAIGNTTAEEIKQFSKNRVVISDMPDKNALLDKAISYLQTNSIHH